MPTQAFDLKTVDRLLSTTRAVRRRLDLDHPVDRRLILECISLSQQAPTGSNQQNWRWLVIDDPGKRRAMSDLYARGLPLIDAAATTAQDPQTLRVYRDAATFTETIAKVPVLVIPCVDGRLPANSPTVHATTYYASIFPAVWSFQLALRSRGLGSVLTTLHLSFEEESREILGLPRNIEQVAMLPVAHTLGLDFKRADRPAAESITHFNRWDED